MRQKAIPAILLVLAVSPSSPSAGAIAANCIFNDAAISAKIIERIARSPALSGTRIDPTQHSAVALVGESLFRVKWWSCEKRGLDAWLVSTSPAAPFTDRIYWAEKVRTLSSVVLDSRDLARVSAGLDHPTKTRAGLLFETADSSFDHLDILLRTDGDLSVIRLNASAD